VCVRACACVCVCVFQKYVGLFIYVRFFESIDISFVHISILATAASTKEIESSSEQQTSAEPAPQLEVGLLLPSMTSLQACALRVARAMADAGGTCIAIN
jgi:hypothetical protein